MRLICKCRKGYASLVDGMCKFCREKQYSRARAKSVGVKHRGDGMTINQINKLEERGRIFEQNY